MRHGDRSFVSVGPDDPDPAVAEDLREGGRSHPEPRGGGDTSLPGGGTRQGSIDENFGHRDGSSFPPGFGASGETVSTDGGESICQNLALGLVGKVGELSGFLP
jgi:hypothetical protein